MTIKITSFITALALTVGSTLLAQAQKKKSAAAD